MQLIDSGRMALSAFLIALCASFGLTPAANAAYVPKQGSEALQKVPSPEKDPRVREYLDLRRKVAAAPDKLDLALKLAGAYLDFGRETGDIRYLGYAEAVLRPWTAKKPQPVPVQVVHATILQSRHQFSEARKALKEVLERAPDNAQAWLTLASVAMVQGDVAEANKACVRTANFAGIYIGAACTSQLRIATGHLAQAYTLLGWIAGGDSVFPAPVNAWIQGLMADAASYQGKPDLADKHFRKGLADTPGDNFLLADYADFLLDQDRPREVLDLLKDYSQSDTSFLRYVLAEAAVKAPGTQGDIWAMGARFAAMDQAGSHLYQREQSRFVLHLQKDPDRALDLARENWQVQRAPWDVRVYLEAALAADQPQAARPVLDFIEETHLTTPHIDALVKKIHGALPRDAMAEKP